MTSKETVRDNITVALVGNPNSGKTSLFNTLTCSHQHVGNYPGVTIEKREGRCESEGAVFHIIDLPGVYSLTSYSPEEVITRNYLLENRNAVVVNVIDATNLERNLYLTIQLLEMGLNVVIALNMIDEAQTHGYQLDSVMMSHRLGCAVVETVGTRGIGNEKLKQAILDAVRRGGSDTNVAYRGELGAELGHLIDILREIDPQYPAEPLFTAVKLLENDEAVVEFYQQHPSSDRVFAQVKKSTQRLEGLYGDAPEILIADRQYGFAAGLVKEMTLQRPPMDRIDLTEKIDTILTNRYLSIPVFFGILYAIFWLTFTLGAPPMEWIDNGIGVLAEYIQSGWPAHWPEVLRSLLVDGILRGVGGVIVFLPNIMLLFVGISFLEDTGYMARVAFIMDNIMHKIDLHGRSFIPLMIGFGCTVPAIMAARTIRSERTRLTTIMILPLMSCGARLTIYLMVIPAFFPSAWQAPVLWVVYLIGVLLAMALAKLLRNTIFSGDAEPFVMELPPYRLPSVRAVMYHMWEKAWMYLKKAGTIILGISIILWALSTYPRKKVFDIDRVMESEPRLTEIQAQAIRDREALEYSIAGRIGKVIEPVMRPMGFDWKIGTAFIGAFAAKEVFVSQLAIVYSLEDAEGKPESLRDTLRSHYSPLIGFCIILFALIATPCSSTIGVIWRETGSIKWPILEWVMLTGLGWVVVTVVYQVGRVVGG